MAFASDETVKRLCATPPRYWRHLWRHLPPLGTHGIPSVALLRSPLRLAVQYSLTAHDWSLLSTNVARYEHAANREDEDPARIEHAVPFFEFLETVARLARWLDATGEIEFGKGGDRKTPPFKTFSWPDGQHPEPQQEFAFYCAQSDADCPHRHLVMAHLHRALPTQSDIDVCDLAVRALDVPQTRQRALYFISGLFRQPNPGDYLTRFGIAAHGDAHGDAHGNKIVPTANAAAFLWALAGFLHNPGDAEELNWHGAHLRLRETLDKTALCEIPDLLESPSAPPGVTLQDVQGFILPGEPSSA